MALNCNALVQSMMEKPDDEEVKETAKETWNALQRVVDMKIQAAQPKTLGPKPGPAQYIKYTPSQQGAQVCVKLILFLFGLI